MQHQLTVEAFPLRDANFPPQNKTVFCFYCKRGSWCFLLFLYISQHMTFPLLILFRRNQLLFSPNGDSLQSRINIGLVQLQHLHLEHHLRFCTSSLSHQTLKLPAGCKEISCKRNLQLQKKKHRVNFHKKTGNYRLIVDTNIKTQEFSLFLLNSKEIIGD